MSVGKVVLGLVIQRPGYGYELEQRVQEQFGSAGFVESSIYKALGRLEKDRRIRPVGGGGSEDGAGSQRRVRYEATPEGVEHFRRWVRASCAGPLVREELQLKIKFCEPRDLPRLIDLVAGEHRYCLGMLEDFNHSLPSERVVLPESAEAEWARLMGLAVDHAESAFWHARITWLERVQILLDELRDEARELAARGEQPANPGLRAL
jgi:DNA-binding PadR family transcriptional regulator